MDISELANNPMAQVIAGILTVAGGYRYWRNQSSDDAAARADNAGQIAALSAWQALLDGERAARIKAEERADRFAAERNEAMQHVWEMRGQMAAMNDQMAAQMNELTQLRDQVRELKEQINAQ